MSACFLAQMGCGCAARNMCTFSGLQDWTVAESYHRACVLWVGEFFSFWAVWLMGVWNASSVCPWPGAYPRLSGIPEMA